MPDLKVLPTKLTRNVTRRFSRRHETGVIRRSSSAITKLPDSKSAPKIKRSHTNVPVACFDQPIKAVVITIFTAAFGTC